MLKALGITEPVLKISSPSMIYSMAVARSFAEGATGLAVESLRRCFVALSSATVPRLTPEFDALIVLQEDENNIAEVKDGVRKHAQRIADILETVDNRAMAADGPVTPTLQEINQRELKELYKSAKYISVHG